MILMSESAEVYINYLKLTKGKLQSQKPRRLKLKETVDLKTFKIHSGLS